MPPWASGTRFAGLLIVLGLVVSVSGVPVDPALLLVYKVLWGVDGLLLLLGF